jgi:hypothetical protein
MSASIAPWHRRLVGKHLADRLFDELVKIEVAAFPDLIGGYGVSEFPINQQRRPLQPIDRTGNIGGGR